VVGRYVNNLVYSRLTAGVLAELNRLNPPTENGYRRHRHQPEGPPLATAGFLLPASKVYCARLESNCFGGDVRAGTMLPPLGKENIVAIEKLLCMEPVVASFSTHRARVYPQPTLGLISLACVQCRLSALI